MRGMKRNNIGICRGLRRNQTDAEKKLWNILRNRQLSGFKFRRQFSVGKYVLDFYCPTYKIGIEADGGRHYEDKLQQQDEIRTKDLAATGIRILRFSDIDILKNTEGVCEAILRVMEDKRIGSPSPQSSPRRGEEAKEPRE